MKKNEPNKRYIELKAIRKFLEVKKDKIAKEGNENVNEFCNLSDKLELLMDEAWKKKEVSAKTSRISINWMQVEEWTKVLKYKPIRVERLKEPLKKVPMKKSLVKQDQGGESVLKQLRQKTKKNTKKKKWLKCRYERKKKYVKMNSLNLKRKQIFHRKTSRKKKVRKMKNERYNEIIWKIKICLNVLVKNIFQYYLFLILLRLRESPYLIKPESVHFWDLQW